MTMPPPQPSPAAPPPVATGPSAPPPTSTVVATNVSKHFKGLVAVSDVSFSVQPGVTALLGPNGAGKSTLLRMLSGLSPCSQGSVWIAGGDPRTSAVVRRQIGIVPQQDGVFENDTVAGFVELSARLNGVPNPAAAARSAIETVELDPTMTKPLGAFSKGMRQRAKIASAIVHSPPVLFLDEPLNGLDPRQRRSMIDLFHRLGEEGRTVMVSSHILEEVERFGEQVLVIVNGRLAAQGSFHGIRSLMNDQPLRYRVTCGHGRYLSSHLLAKGLISGCRLYDEYSFELTTTDAVALKRGIAGTAKDINVRLLEVEPLDADLESVFRYLVGGR